MATWICRTTFSGTLTANAEFIGAGPDGAGVLWSSTGRAGSGTAQIPFPSDSFIYLDGSASATLLADLPSGFTPDDAFDFNHFTAIGQSGDQIIYTVPTASPQMVTADTVDPIGAWYNVPLTGMTSLSIFASAHVLASMSNINMSGAGAIFLNLLGGVWDPAVNVSISGTYTIVDVLVTPPKLPPMPIRTPIMQGGGSARRGR